MRSLNVGHVRFSRPTVPAFVTEPADAQVRERKLPAKRRRFGYRRLHFLLSREGCHMNQKRFRRLYRE